MMPDFMPVIIVVVVALFIVLAIFSSMQAAKRRKELMAWAGSKGLSFTETRDHSFDERFSEFDCLKQGSDRYAFNRITGTLSGRRVLAFDYHYETTSHDSKGHTQTHNHYFSAVIVQCALPLKPLFIRPEGFFDKIGQFLGFDDIDFESAEFSKEFYVKAQDRRWAYDVIHARTMEFLLGMPRFTIQFQDSNVIVHDGSTFDVGEFETALQVVEGILDGFPDYLVKQLTEGV